MTTTVLVTGMGGPTPLACARALRTASTRGVAGPFELVGTDADPQAPGLLSQHLDAAYVVPRADEPGYADAIRAVVNEHGVDVALVEPEYEIPVWGAWIEQGDVPCSVRVPGPSFARVASDKAATARVLAGSGLAPTTVDVAQHESVYERLVGKLGGPFWLRATTGAGGRGAGRIGSQAELDDWFVANAQVEEFSASQFLPGRTFECVIQYVDGRAFRTAVAECTPHRAKYPGNTRVGIVRAHPQVTEYALEAVSRVAETTGTELNGVVTVDLTEDGDGNALVTEINPRMIAFIDVFAAFGWDFVTSEVELARGRPAMVPNEYVELPLEGVFVRDEDMPPSVLVGKDAQNWLALRSGSGLRQIPTTNGLTA